MTSSASRDVSTATHLPTPQWLPPMYGTSQYGIQAFGIQTNRETSQPANVFESSQFETLATYNDSSRRAVQRSNLRWVIAPGSLKHMDRVLDSAQINETALYTNDPSKRYGAPDQNTRYGGEVIAHNNPLPLMSVPGGAAIQGNFGLLGPNTTDPNSIPDWLWSRKVVGINNQLLDIPYGAILRGAVAGLPERRQALNWNVQQPGQPWIPSAAAANYVTLPR